MADDLYSELTPEEWDAIQQSSVVPQKLKQLLMQQQESAGLRHRATQVPEGRTVRNGIFVASTPSEYMPGVLSGLLGGIRGGLEQRQANQMIGQEPAGTSALLKAYMRLQGSRGGSPGPAPDYTPPPPPQTPPTPPGVGDQPPGGSQFVDQSEDGIMSMLGPEGQQSTGAGAGQEGDFLTDGVVDPMARAAAQARIKALRDRLLQFNQMDDDLVWGK